MYKQKGESPPFLHILPYPGYAIFTALDQATIIANRINFFLTMTYATDNTNIQVAPICGILISLTETMFWNYHDPYTLETRGQLDLRKSKNFPQVRVFRFVIIFQYYYVQNLGYIATAPHFFIFFFYNFCSNRNDR